MIFFELVSYSCLNGKLEIYIAKDNFWSLENGSIKYPHCQKQCLCCPVEFKVNKWIPKSSWKMELKDYLILVYTCIYVSQMVEFQTELFSPAKFQAAGDSFF